MSDILILGPCSIESEELFLSILKKLDVLLEGKDWYMKASFDKANRTSIYGKRGPGLEASRSIWKTAKEEFPNIKLTTDFHECKQINELEDLIDVAQIPAFLCRQTDLITECSKAFEVVNIKKGQWIGPDNLKTSVDKVKEVNNDCEAWITDRGSNFGYHDLFVNFGIVDELKKYYDKVILDCTHSTQRSRVVYGTQGQPALAERYFISAPLFNYDGVFAEVHPDPLSSPSDGECMINLNRVPDLLSQYFTINNLNKAWS